MALADYFSDKALITALCHLRIKEADKAEMVANGFNSRPGQQFRYTTAQYLPPRRLWNQYRPRTRTKLGTTKATELSLRWATIQNLDSEQPWARSLKELLGRVRQRALASDSFSFGQPRISAVPKKENIYRPLASFTLEDKLIDGALAKYWKDQLDELFEPASMAFRCRPTDGNPMPSTHLALDLICEKRTKSHDEGIYVAECDIKGFFDCVDHEVAKTQLQRLIALKQAKNPSNVIEPRAIQLFDAFLACFTFREDVLNGYLPRLQKRVPGVIIKWPEADLRQLHSNFTQARIGVPQGGAMSGVIANIVLDFADKEVKRLGILSKRPVTYLRYCDDMIILAQTRDQCSQVFQTYLSTLRQLKLPYHEPKEIRFYDQAFWEVKSRLPYRWSGRKWFNCVPWIQFVGYQIRYDGLVRIRKESEAKHIGKVIEKTGWFINAFLPKSQRQRTVAPIQPDTEFTKGQVVGGLHGRLSSMSVGRPTNHQAPQGPKPMCWASGFKGLHQKPFVDGILRRLDRIRGKQISRFIQKPIRFSGHSSQFRLSKEEAYRDSYHGQFSNAEGGMLVKNPYKPTLLERLLLIPFYSWRYREHKKSPRT